MWNMDDTVIFHNHSSGSYVPCTICHVISFEKRTLVLISDVLADEIIGFAGKWWAFCKNNGSYSAQCKRFLQACEYFCSRKRHDETLFLPSQSSSVIKSKIVATTIRTWTSSLRPSKIRLHFRLRFLEQALPLRLPFALYPTAQT